MKARLFCFITAGVLLAGPLGITAKAMPASVPTTGYPQMEENFAKWGRKRFDDCGLLREYVSDYMPKDYFASADAVKSEYDARSAFGSEKPLTLCLNYPVNENYALIYAKFDSDFAKQQENLAAVSAILAEHFPDETAGTYSNDGMRFTVTNKKDAAENWQQIHPEYNMLLTELKEADLIDAFYFPGNVYAQREIYFPYLTGYYSSKSPNSTATVNPDDLQAFIDSNHLTCTLQTKEDEHAFMYYVVPDEAMSFAEHYQLALNIRNDLHLLPYAYDDIFKSSYPAYGAVPGVVKDDNPELDFYGLAAETPEMHLNLTDEKKQIKVVWDEDCYLPDRLYYQSENVPVAYVNDKGIIDAQSEGTAMVRITATLNRDKVTLAPRDPGIRTIYVKITVTDPNMTDEKRAALQRLKEAEKAAGGTFERENGAIHLERIAQDTRRLTMEEVSRYIDESECCEEILAKIMYETNLYPDYHWYLPIDDDKSSPNDGWEYWFDNSGTEKIYVLSHQEQISYARLNHDGTVAETQLLYPERQEPVSPADKTTDAVYRSYHALYLEKWAGDANGDGQTDVADVVLIARYAVEDKEAVMTQSGKENADVTQDGNVDGQDAEKLLAYIAKKISFAEMTASPKA